MMEGDKKNFVDQRYAGRKDDDYGNVIADILEKGCCPFCPEFFKWHRKSILEEKDGWLITESSWPYKNTEHHLIIIPRRHMEKIEELKNSDLATAFELMNNFIKKHNIPGGGITLRFGDTRYTGATVTHLHFHFFVPHKKPENDVSETIYFPIG